MGQPAVLTPNIACRTAGGPRRETGAGLVLALFAMVLLTGAGVALLSVMQTATKMNQADQRAKKAFYLAEAGVQRGREILRQRRLTEGAGMINAELAKARGANATIDLAPEQIRPVFDGAGQFTGLAGPGLAGSGKDTPLVDKTALGEGFYYAFLTNDPIDGRSTANDANHDERVILVGVGVGPNHSFEVVENVVQVQDLIPDFPATVTLLGPNPTFFPGTSTHKLLSGDDCEDPAIYRPVVGVVDGDLDGAASDEVVYVQGQLTPQTKADQTMRENSLGYKGAQTIQSVDAGSWTSCDDLQALAAYVRGNADYSVPSGTTPDMRQIENLTNKIVYVDGDLTLTGAGAGVLWVTGTLTINGNTTWEGPIFAVGKGVVVINGGGNASLLGASVVANIAGADGIFGNADDCAGGMGPASFMDNGNGRHTTQYCNKYLQSSLNRLPIRPLDFRQH